LAAFVGALPALMEAAAPSPCLRPEARRRHRGQLRKPSLFIGTSSVVKKLHDSAVQRIFVDTRLIVNSFLLPVAVFFPGLLMMMGVLCVGGTARLSYQYEPYVANRRGLVRARLLACRRLPPPLLTARWTVPMRPTAAPPRTAGLGWATLGRGALCPRQFSAGRSVTCALLPPEVDAGAATVHSAWGVLKAAARARPPLEEGALAAKMIIALLMIIISIVALRALPCGLMGPAAVVAASIRSASRRPAAGLIAACGRRPRRCALAALTMSPCGHGL
jgi:hypothetical protein